MCARTPNQAINCETREEKRKQERTRMHHKCIEKTSHEMQRQNVNLSTGLKTLHAIPFDLVNIYGEVHSINIQMAAIRPLYNIPSYCVFTADGFCINSFRFCLLATGNKFT